MGTSRTTAILVGASSLGLAVMAPVMSAPGVVDAARAAAPNRRPDVIVIMTDDQRVGSEKGMPYLWDELRPEMVYYPNAQVPNNVCCPSRSTFLSGRYSHTTGVWDNTASGHPGGWKAFYKSGYERKTLATALKRRGYKTVLLGKYLNQYFQFRNPRKDHPPGWSDFRTYVHSNSGYWSPPHPVARVPRGYLTDTLGDAAVQIIASTPAERPLFLMYTPHAPHAPATAGPYEGTADAAGALERMREAGEWTNPAVGEPTMRDKPAFYRRLPRLQRDEGPGSPFPKVRRFTRRQADTLMGVDANIRKIMDMQRAVRDWDNTVVVFTSDNGVAWGDHHLFDKTTPYRLTNGVPLLIKYPSWAANGVDTDRRLINQLDVTATIAQFTPARLATDGRSALRPPDRDGLLLESPTSKNNYPYWHPAYCGWRTKDAVYVRYSSGTEELYDNRDDPYELDNRARDPGFRALKTAMLVPALLACNPPPPNYTRPRPVVRLNPITATSTRMTLTPGIPFARVVVQRRNHTGWTKIGACRIPEPVTTTRSMTLHVVRAGSYRARMAHVGSFRTSAWSNSVLMSPSSRTTCR